MSRVLGLIVGSGFRRLGLNVLEEHAVDTPYGAPSGPLLTVRIAGVTALGLARHGPTHSIAPHEVNYRANVWALHAAGVTTCIATNAVGTIAAGFTPGELAVPDQLIDYTSGRESSFGGADGGVAHIEFTEPFDPALRGRLASALAESGQPVHAGVYGVTQGPRLETAAEIDRAARDGCAMVGMTAMPEAALARELGMAYAVCALGVNRAAGRSEGGSIHAEIEQSLERGLKRLADLLEWVVPTLV